MQSGINIVYRPIIVLGVLLSGCWGLTLQPVQAPYVTHDPPYAAILQFPYRQDERILDVTVREELGARNEYTYQFSTCWQIKAIEPVSAAGFKVQMGVVPEGFTQTLPLGGEQFAPAAGKKYIVRIVTTNRRADYCGWWTPGQ